MKNAKRGAVAVELNNELYVIGGVTLPVFYENEPESFLHSYPLATNADFLLDSVEKYNPINKMWMNVAHLLQRRITHSASVFNGKNICWKRIFPRS